MSRSIHCTDDKKKRQDKTTRRIITPVCDCNTEYLRLLITIIIGPRTSNSKQIAFSFSEPVIFIDQTSASHDDTDQYISNNDFAQIGLIFTSKHWLHYAFSSGLSQVGKISDPSHCKNPIFQSQPVFPPDKSPYTCIKISCTLIMTNLLSMLCCAG